MEPEALWQSVVGFCSSVEPGAEAVASAGRKLEHS
jgi:hypothetical protein